MTTNIFLQATPENTIYNGKLGYVILDGPLRPGHVLVAIKSEVKDLHQADPNELSDMVKLAQVTSRAIVDELGCEKTYMVAIGDKDPHYHVHLLPRFNSDPSLGPGVFGSDGWGQNFPAEPDMEEVKRVANVLRARLNDLE
ncbi:HIT family protein [Candidatus Kaiserbacteria bacterium]|nr:HIT family protein [Candidatus Kaiserbacteria bacterium]